MSMKNTEHDDDNGFSMMELTVVVSIVGIIVAIAILIMGNVQDNARQAVVETAARDANVLAQANILNGDPTAGDLSSVESENVTITMANTFVLGDESTVCTRADWTNSLNYAISGPCDDRDITPPDRDAEDPLYTQLTYQCPTTKSGYLGVVNIGEDTRVQMWDNSDREETEREISYGAPDEDFDLRSKTRREILRTRIAEQSDIETANTAIKQAVDYANEFGDGERYAPEYSIENTIDNVSELIEMEGGVTYTVRFDGEIETFAAPGHRGGVEGNIEESIADCLVSIDHFGDDINLKNLVYLGGENLTRVPSNIPPSVKALRGAFENASHFNDRNIESWDVSNVHTLRGMFYNAHSFNRDISGWDVGNVIFMQMMFYNTDDFNQDLSDWDTSSVTDMSRMFQLASGFNGDISGWDTSNVTSMHRMFEGAENFNQNINYNAETGAWDTSNVTDVSGMFRSAPNFNQDISDWNVSKVTTTNLMFYQASSFNQPLSSWDVSNVTIMTRMFDEATSFNQDISSWDVSNVTARNHFNRDSGLEEQNLPAGFTQ